MRNRQCAIPVALALSLLVASATAQGIKIGFIDTDKVIASCPPIQAEEEALEAKENQLKTMQGKIKQQEMELEAQKPTLKEDDITRREAEIKEQKRQLLRYLAKVEREMKEAQAQKIDPVVDVIERIIIELGKKDGYSLILDKDDILYGTGDLDLTDKVVELVKQRFSGSGSSTSSEGASSSDSSSRGVNSEREP